MKPHQNARRAFPELEDRFQSDQAGTGKRQLLGHKAGAVIPALEEVEVGKFLDWNSHAAVASVLRVEQENRRTAADQITVQDSDSGFFLTHCQPLDVALRTMSNPAVERVM